MAVRDNREIINTAEATTYWGGTDVGTNDNGSGLFYQGSFAISAQFSNNLTPGENLYASNTDGGTALNLDLDSATVYVLAKDNLTADEATGGYGVYLYDGTNGIGFTVGGNDNVPFTLPKLYNSLRLDVSNRSIYGTLDFAGTPGNLNTSSISRVGYSSQHALQARGNVDNVWVDKLTYIQNSDYTFTVYGGSASNPNNFGLISDSDAGTTNGWGCFTQSGTSFDVYASVLFGDSANGGAGYFTQTNSQVFFDGEGMGAGNFKFKVGGNSGNTQSFVLDNNVLVSKGTPAPFDFSDPNVDTIDIQNTQFVDFDTIDFSDSTGVRIISNDTFINCGQINLKNISANNLTINGTRDSATGALIFDSDGCCNNQSDFAITSGGSGHGIYITDPGSYTFTDFNFFDYFDSNGSNPNSSNGSTDAAVYNNSGGAVSISIVGGGTPSVRNGASATTTVSNNISVTVTNLKDNTEVRVFLTSTLDDTPPYSFPTEVAGIENATAGGPDDREYTFSIASGTDITIRTFNENWIADDITITPTSTQDVQVAQRQDRVFSNV